jgi:hypothetical protein
VTCCSIGSNGTPEPPAEESGARAGMANAAARFGDEAGAWVAGAGVTPNLMR